MFLQVLRGATFILFTFLIYKTLASDDDIEKVMDFGYTVQLLIDQGKLTENDIFQTQHLLRLKAINNLPDEMVSQFLLASDLDINNTVSTIQKYFTIRHENPEIFTNRSIDNDDLKQALETAQFAIIPRKTRDNYDVVIMKLISSDSSKMETVPFLKLIIMIIDTINIKYPSPGIILIYDLQQMGFKHLFKVNMGAVMTFISYVQEGFPTKLKNIHIMNMMYVVSKLISWIKPLMGEQMRNMMVTHQKPMDMDAFYEAYVESECLPVEMGGSQPSLEILHENTKAMLRKMLPTFEAEEALRENVASKATNYYKNSLYITLAFSIAIPWCNLLL